MYEERKKEKNPEGRRDYLKVVAGTAAGLVIGGAAAYLAKPAEFIEKVETVTAPGKTIEKTVTVTAPATPPTPTAPMLSPFDIRTNVEDWVDTMRPIPYWKDPPWVIGISTHHMAPSWMAIFLRELQEEIKALDKSEGEEKLVDEVLHVDAGGEIKKQISDIRDLMAKGADVLIIDPASPEGSAPIIEEAFDAGFPIILPKNYVDTPKYVSYSNNDEVQFGYQSAGWFVEQLGGKGDILCLRGIPGYGVDIQRWSGATMVFEKYPDIKILAEEYAYWDYSKAKVIAVDMLSAHPKFDGIWSMGGQMSAAMVDAMLEAGYDVAKYPHASEDYNRFCKQVVEHNIPAYASAKPVWEGRVGARAAFDTLRGLPIKKNYIFPSPGFGPEEIPKLVRPGLPDQVWVSTTLPDAILEEMFK